MKVKTVFLVLIMVAVVAVSGCVNTKETEQHSEVEYQPDDVVNNTRNGEVQIETPKEIEMPKEAERSTPKAIPGYSSADEACIQRMLEIAYNNPVEIDRSKFKLESEGIERICDNKGTVFRRIYRGISTDEIVVEIYHYNLEGMFLIGTVTKSPGEEVYIDLETTSCDENILHVDGYMRGAISNVDVDFRADIRGEGSYNYTYQKDFTNDECFVEMIWGDIGEE